MGFELSYWILSVCVCTYLDTAEGGESTKDLILNEEKEEEGWMSITDSNCCVLTQIFKLD